MHGLPRRIDFVDGYAVRLRAALNGGDGKLMTLSEGGAYVATPLNLLPQAAALGRHRYPGVGADRFGRGRGGVGESRQAAAALASAGRLWDSVHPRAHRFR